MEKLEGAYINGYNGELIQITNIEQALIEAKGAVHFHDVKMNRHKTDPEEIIFPEAQKEWKHNLLELEKLELKLKQQVKEKPVAVKETSIYSEPVMKAREMFGTEGEPGFIRNGTSSPLYSKGSNWLFMGSESRIRLGLLKIGESTENSSRTKITRIR